jgi:SAM-dependent methyltransferase
VRAPNLEEAQCPLCRRSPGRVVRRACSWLDDVPGRYEVRMCDSCGLWITSPRPGAADLGLVYPPSYHRRGVEDARFPAAAPVRGLLLDVGCGVGDGLVKARSEGWRCFGIEISEQAAAIARSRGFPVIVGDATTVEYPPEKFDMVRCWHTLEHVPDPLILLERLREATRDGGRISLILPNGASLTSMLFRGYWFHLDLPRHLHHFRPRDVIALAARSRLQLTRIRHTASPSGLLGSVDCLIASHFPGTQTRLRSRPRLWKIVRPVTWIIGRFHLADVVEYELVRDDTRPISLHRIAQ